MHTTLSDGQLSPLQVADHYKDLGFDFVAITDHDYLLRPNYRAMIPAHNGILVFHGVELTIFEKGYIHVNRIYGDKEILHIFNHPAEYDLEFNELLKILESVAEKFPIDAVEISSKGFYTPEYDIDLVPYPKIASDDSHTKLGCGRAWIELECERNPDSIIRAIKAGDSKPCFR